VPYGLLEKIRSLTLKSVVAFTLPTTCQKDVPFQPTATVYCKDQIVTQKVEFAYAATLWTGGLPLYVSACQIA
jgi:hypothetical protein